jgi:uncharacterized membrane protein (UPF0127 family)
VVLVLLCGCGVAPRGEALVGFEGAEIVVGGDTWNVAVADDAGERSRGLMGVTDLGDLDGMLFVFAGDTETAFWMKDTLIPLDVAFFAADGELVDLLHMVPCASDPCPTYQAAAAYRYALEVPAGGFGGIRELYLECHGPVEG